MSVGVRFAFCLFAVCFFVGMMLLLCVLLFAVSLFAFPLCLVALRLLGSLRLLPLCFYFFQFFPVLLLAFFLF